MVFIIQLDKIKQMNAVCFLYLDFLSLHMFILLPDPDQLLKLKMLSMQRRTPQRHIATMHFYLNICTKTGRAYTQGVRYIHIETTSMKVMKVKYKMVSVVISDNGVT